MADTPANSEPEVKTETPAAPESAATSAAVEAKTEPASLLATADAAKHEGAVPESAPATDEKSAAESGQQTPPETAEAKTPEAPEAKTEEKAEGDKEPAKQESESKTETKEALAEPPPAPSYDAPTVPEGVSLDTQRLSDFDKKLGDFELKGKVDHTVMSEIRQMAITEYLSEVKRISEQVAQYQRDVWNRINEQRVNELKSDPTLGGNRIETTLGNAKYALESMVGLTKDEAKQLIDVMDAGGVSNHRLMIKALHGVYERLREPEPVPSNPSPISERGQRNWYSQVDGASAA